MGETAAEEVDGRRGGAAEGGDGAGVVAFCGHRWRLGGDPHLVASGPREYEDVAGPQIDGAPADVDGAAAVEQQVEGDFAGGAGRVVQYVAAGEQAAHVDGALQAGHPDERADRVHGRG